MKSNSALLPIILFFIGLIVLGTVLLCLPFARVNPELSVLNCLFTVTSAVCVTGLSVVNISQYFTLSGQIIIMCLVQIGAFGYMLVSTGLGFLLGKIALKDRKIMQELFDISSFNDLFKLLRKAILIVLCIELAGAVVLTLKFMGSYPLQKAIFLGLFHSIMAFCNAGFSLFENSMELFSNSPAVLWTLSSLILLGGLGFFVLVDIIEKFYSETKKLTFHSEVILWVTFCLTLIAAIVLFLGNLNSFADKSFAFILNNSVFQSLSIRTAGFNSLPITDISMPIAFFSLALMFIGGGPGSTAGGLKITTLALVFVFVRALIKGENEYNLAKKSIDVDLIKKALLIFIVMVSLLFLFVFAMLCVEQNSEPLNVIFEVVSAFCTVGLSLGITSSITAAGKVILIVAMFIGRIGAVTILIYVVNTKTVKNNIRYPDARLMIG
ncbi:TrkH family potassium uptake protein [Candidatus Ruminimicrobium bovinum]|uniref:TrkH family potassium uptake protein n=1 Tax=Candidatus Ruminimicrobium bovinum TaxID=3242779 RepID=UPI0039B97134